MTDRFARLINGLDPPEREADPGNVEEEGKFWGGGESPGTTGFWGRLYLGTQSVQNIRRKEDGQKCPQSWSEYLGGGLRIILPFQFAAIILSAFNLLEVDLLHQNG